MSKHKTKSSKSKATKATKSKARKPGAPRKTEEGNPFFAFRVPVKVLVAYCRKVGGRPEACKRLREHMARVAEVTL
jgi:hypothetical protein